MAPFLHRSLSPGAPFPDVRVHHVRYAPRRKLAVRYDVGLDGRRHDAVAETSAVVRDELARMGRLVEDLMALARSRSEGFIQRARMELPAFFAELRLRLTGLPVENVRVADVPDVAIEADQERLAQALLNLVLNAHVHTPAGTSVAVMCRLSRGWVIFTVQDDGPGMYDAIRRDAFEAFVSGASSHNSAGLGLAVVRAVAEGHGGDVRLDSGRSGTAVTLRIPGQGVVAAAAPARPSWISG